MQDNVLIKVSNLNFRYNKTLALSNINLTIKKGENIAIIGRNGGGKSTLIKILLGVLKKYEGNIEFNLNKNDFGYLPQIRNFNVDFPITIFDLVISGLVNKINIFTKFNAEDRKKTDIILEEFELTDIKDKMVFEVSGGQLQRALIARALIAEKKIIFLDEPESYLDKNFEDKLFNKINSMKDSTIIIISHQLHRVKKYADKIYMIEKELSEILSEDFDENQIYCDCDIIEDMDLKVVQ